MSVSGGEFSWTTVQSWRSLVAAHPPFEGRRITEKNHSKPQGNEVREVSGGVPSGEVRQKSRRKRGGPACEGKRAGSLESAERIRGRLSQMSVRATNFVRGLRGLSPMEKLIGLVMADHDDHRGSGAYPGMTTVADEAGLKNRETASRITGRLVEKSVLIREKQSGRPTVYRFNYNRQTCDSPVTPPVTPQSHLPVTGGVTAGPQTCDSPVTGGVTAGPQTCDSPVTLRVEGKKKEKGKQGSATKNPSPFVLNRRASVIEEFGEETYLALLEFEKHRKKIGKPLGERGVELILKRLGELRAQGQDPVKVLEQSVMNGWQGIFPVKGDGSAPKSFHERRTAKSAQAIDRVLGRLAESPSIVQRALPSTRK